MEEKKEHTLVPLAPKQEGYNPFANNGLSLYTEAPSPYRIGGCAGIFRKLRSFRRSIFWITCIVLVLLFFNKHYSQEVPLESTTCPVTWTDSLQYPKSFSYKYSSAQTRLNFNIRRLARAYGKDVFGECYQPSFARFPFGGNVLQNPTPSDSYPSYRTYSNRPSQKYASPSASATHQYGHSPTPYYSKNSGDTLTMASTAPAMTTGSSNIYFDLWSVFDSSLKKYVSARWSNPKPGFPTPISIDNLKTAASFSVFEYTGLDITSNNDIEVLVEILYASQAPRTLSSDPDKATVYLLPYDLSDNETSIYESVSLVEVPIRMNTAGLKLVPRSLDYGSKVKCRLQVVLPPSLEHTQEESKPSLRNYAVSIKEGQIQASGITASNMNLRVGRGSVEFSSIEVYTMSIVMLDGAVNMLGVKFTENLAIGVIRGSSTVLAKRQPSDASFTLINMCTDGYTYTDFMTPGDDVEGLASEFHIYRDTGGPLQGNQKPMIKLPGDVYSSDDELVHLDYNSTDVYKTGYLVSRNTESKILIYTGAKSAENRELKSRFMYGFYNENITAISEQKIDTSK